MIGEGMAGPEIQIGEWSLSEALKAGPVLLVFFKISCPTCQFTFPFLERLFQNAGPGSPRIVGISQDDAKGTGQFTSHFRITFPVLADAGPGYAASNRYRIENVPSLFLIETDGRVSLAASGFSKANLEALGARFGGSPFRCGEQIPALRPG